jgi:L-ascorbate metabolism protein UlaG (beta-lactamase superfamily)
MVRIAPERRLDPLDIVAHRPNNTKCRHDTDRMGGKMKTDHIHWLGHDSFRLDGPVTIYIDPFRLSGALPPAGLILITHDHYDHCSPDDVKKIQGPDTVIVTVPAAAAKLSGTIQTIRIGDKIEVKGVPIEAVPAYNIDKRFHPKEAGNVGFIVTIEGQRVYHAGDTDLIPEMSAYKVDVALLPVSGTYVMTAAEAVEAAKAIKPKLIIPMHYGAIIGSDADATYLAQHAGIETLIPKKE